MSGSGSDSDSDAECYGNIATKLQKLKNNYREALPPPCKPVNSSSFNVNPTNSSINLNLTSATDASLNDSTISIVEELDADGLPPRAILPPLTSTIVASPPASKKGTRRSKRISKQPSSPTLPAVSLSVPAKRGRRKNNAIPLETPSHASSLDSSTSQESTPARGRRGRGGQGGRASSRGRGIEGARGNQRARGRGRGGRGRRSRTSILDAFIDFMGVDLNNPQIDSVIYSVGNTLEYDDPSESQPLFSNQTSTKTNNEKLLAEDVDLSSSFADENEELSVKVYWQNSEYVKFNIRRFQKIIQIFDYFSKREKVPFDNLLFTLGDKILKADDTPDSLNYNIGLFIDGGIVKCSVASIVPDISKENVKLSSGIRIKFQCQNIKRPFETNVELNEKFVIPMAKCAEHFDMPIFKLKFYFDGDQLSATSTPAENDMEGGECVDVKFVT